MKNLSEALINFIYRTVTGPQRIRSFLSPIFAAFFLFLILLAIFSAFYIDHLFGFPEFIFKPYNRLLSSPFLVLGIILWGWSAGKFFRTKGTPVPINPPLTLVTDGPYAYSRNPMMTGAFLMLTGIGILAGSITLTFVITPIFVFLSILEFKQIEEPELEKRFGEAYMEYKKRTPIIFPKIL
jgi:protein-S-isoprenylcysteine O-methyltransferase Ste14